MPQVNIPSPSTLLVDAISSVSTWRVGTKRPNPSPARYIQVINSGGPSSRVILQALVTITCYAESTGGVSGDIIAEDEAIRVHSYLLNESSSIPLVRNVQSVRSPYFDPDPNTGNDRYSFTVRITIRGSRF